MNIYSPRRKQWDQKFELKRFTFPIEIPQDHFYHRKRFKITLFYTKKGNSKKQYAKTIHFGVRGIKNKIDGDVEPKSKRIPRTDLFHPYFWEKTLLDTQQTLQEAFAKAVRKLTKQ